jgi:glycosyltransferase involved in cell wall biosynthesis
MPEAINRAPLKACILMLTMNEQEAVCTQIDEIRKHAGPDIPIVIVDSSSDDTPALASGLGAKVIRQYPPMGYGKAMLVGQREAAKIADVIITMDADMTYPAERINEFIDLIGQGYDCVSGNRIQGSGEGMPLLNRLGNQAFAGLVRLLFNCNVKDLTTGMRAYRSSVITSIEWVPLRFFPAEQALRLYQSGCRVIEVPIDYRIRIGEVKMRKVRDTLALLHAIYHCWKKPLQRLPVQAFMKSPSVQWNS